MESSLLQIDLPNSCVVIAPGAFPRVKSAGHHHRDGEGHLESKTFSTRPPNTMMIAATVTPARSGCLFTAMVMPGLRCRILRASRIASVPAFGASLEEFNSTHCIIGLRLARL